MPLIILSELTLMSIIFNAFISRGEKSTFFCIQACKTTLFTKHERQESLLLGL